jgi:hypothetical protein
MLCFTSYFHKHSHLAQSGGAYLTSKSICGFLSILYEVHIKFNHHQSKEIQMKQTKVNSIPKPTIVSTVYPMRIIKEAKCPTLSGKETLTYQMGSNTESEVHLMVTSNTGGGFFSIEWVSLKAAQALLEQAPQPLTSYALRHLFKGKSANNPAFLMAALKHEGLVVAHPDKQRCYVCTEAAVFNAEISKLQASDVNIKVEAKSEQVPSFTKSASIKKPEPVEAESPAIASNVS